MSEAVAPAEGPLTVDQATAALLAPKVAEEQPQEAPQPAADGEETEGAASAPEDAEGEAEQPAEAKEAEAEAEPVVAADPPTYWSKDAKEAFGQLSPDLQAVVLAQEGPREEAAAKAKAEAAAIRQQAEAEMGKVSLLASELAEFLPQAVQKFRHQYGDRPDWEQYAVDYGTEAMTLAKVKYDADLSDLQRLVQATEKAQQEAQTTYVTTEFARLAEIAPDLTDAQDGLGRRQEITKYLVAQGVEPEAVRNISATEMLLAQKAMKYDAAQAALKAAPKPKPAAPAPKVAPVRPAAQAAQSNPTKQAEGRFYQNPTIENAAALLLARKG